MIKKRDELKAIAAFESYQKRIIMKLSKRERSVICEGLLALLDNIHKAKCFVHDQKTTKAMDEYEKE